MLRGKQLVRHMHTVRTVLRGKRLGRETVSYHDPNQLYNPGAINILNFFVCLTKQNGLINQKFNLLLKKIELLYQF